MRERFRFCNLKQETKEQNKLIDCPEVHYADQRLHKRPIFTEELPVDAHDSLFVLLRRVILHSCTATPGCNKTNKESCAATPVNSSRSAVSLSSVSFFLSLRSRVPLQSFLKSFVLPKLLFSRLFLIEIYFESKYSKKLYFWVRILKDSICHYVKD